MVILYIKNKKTPTKRFLLHYCTNLELIFNFWTKSQNPEKAGGDRF